MLRETEEMTKEEAIDYLDTKVIAMFRGTKWEKAVEMAIEALKVQPKRPKGKWTDGKCSVCGCKFIIKCNDGQITFPILNLNFCPECGADMRGTK